MLCGIWKSFSGTRGKACLQSSLMVPANYKVFNNDANKLLASALKKKVSEAYIREWHMVMEETCLNNQGPLWFAAIQAHIHRIH